MHKSTFPTNSPIQWTFHRLRQNGDTPAAPSGGAGRWLGGFGWFAYWFLYVSIFNGFCWFCLICVGFYWLVEFQTIKPAILVGVFKRVSKHEYKQAESTKQTSLFRTKPSKHENKINQKNSYDLLWMYKIQNPKTAEQKLQRTQKWQQIAH